MANNTRLSPTEIRLMLPYLQLEGITYRFRYVCKPEVALCILLYRLSAPCRLKSMMHVFQRSRGWICVIFNDVGEHIIASFRDLLFWDSTRLTQETIAEYASAIEREGGVKGVWGFIDSTMRAICRPEENQEPYYSGYKKCHAVKYQAIRTPDGLISHIVGPYTGRESDWMAYQNPGLVLKL